MFRIAFAALIVSAATPAIASSHYQAQPQAAPSETKLVLRDTVWSCGDAGCAAGKSKSRPAVVCAVLAKEVGVLSSFSVGGEEISPDELEKCNSRAR